MISYTVITFFLLFSNKLICGDTIVETETGPVRGLKVGKLEAYLGIPYAEPPTGQLRFAKPLPKKPWSQVYDATSLPPPCVQLDFSKTFGLDVSKMSEDCLHLNLWVPAKINEDELKTVMVYIHGGGFLFGASSMEMYNGANLAELGNVIVVTINYRLGSLGFFAGFTEDTPGSQGLYDQVMAMQWIKDNAQHFGGDPDNIVIFGESAGAFSVSMHQISPLSKNLFKRVILQSGSSINPMYSNKNGIVTKVSQTYANMLGCNKEDDDLINNPSEVIDCLRNIPAKKFAAVDSELFKKGVSSILVPRIGNDFLPEETIDLFRKGQFKDSEVLMGIDKDEGTLLLGLFSLDTIGLFGEKVHGEVFNETTAYDSIKNMMGSKSVSTEDEKIIQSYLDDVSSEKGYLDVVAEAWGDSIITCGKIFQAEYQSMRENEVYFYRFDHRSPNSPFPEWMGVPHAVEIQYVFGNPTFGTFTEYDKELSNDIMSMWTTFAKTGNPNIPGNIEWPRYTYEDPKYLRIGKRDKIGTRPDENRCERWRKRFRSTIDTSVIQALKKKHI